MNIEDFRNEVLSVRFVFVLESLFLESRGRNRTTFLRNKSRCKEVEPGVCVINV